MESLDPSLPRDCEAGFTGALLLCPPPRLCVLCAALAPDLQLTLRTAVRVISSLDPPSGLWLVSFMPESEVE